MSASTEDFIKKIPLFKGLNKRHRTTIAKTVFERSFDAGETIIKQGEQGLGMYMIRSGRVEVVREGAGEEQRLNTLGPGEYFGEIALLTDQPRTATVRAVEPTECLVLTAWNFRSEVQQSADLATQLLKVVGERLARSDKALSAR
jgi:CRP/FNR family transcriptional regulator